MQLPFGGAGDSDSYRKLLMAQLGGQAFDTSPVQHWTQGANRMAQAALLGMLGGREQREKAEYDKELVKLLGGSTMPTTPQTSIASVGQPAASTQTAGKIYEANEPSPLDPPGGGERDQMIRLLHAEAGNEAPQGQQAVANVIRNRAVEGSYGGDTPTGVMNKPYAFEPMMSPQGRQRMASLDPNSTQYQNLGGAVDRAYTGDDPTRGATHFYSPNAQAALGRQPPSWGTGQGQDIGQHRFFGGAGGQLVQMAQASPQTATPGQPDIRGRLQEMMSSPNPKIRELGRGIMQQQIQQQLKPADYDFKNRDDGSIVAINKKDPRDIRLLQPPGGSQSLVDFAGAQAGAKKHGELSAEKNFKAPERRAAETQRVDTVINAIDRATSLINTSKTPTTGAMGGQVLSNVGGTAAHDVAAQLETLGANLGFQQLQQMRDASPTGGALGSITEKEMALLQAAAGNVRQSQSAEQLKENLGRLRQVYSDVVHGPQGRQGGQPQNQGGGRRTRTGVQWSLD